MVVNASCCSVGQVQQGQPASGLIKWAPCQILKLKLSYILTCASSLPCDGVNTPLAQCACPVCPFPSAASSPARLGPVCSPDSGHVLPLQFAATACTIVSGAIAERTRFEAYAIYSFFMSAWVYPIITHSAWSFQGWASMFK